MDMWRKSVHGSWETLGRFFITTMSKLKLSAAGDAKRARSSREIITQYREAVRLDVDHPLARDDEVAVDSLAGLVWQVVGKRLHGVESVLIDAVARWMVVSCGSRSAVDIYSRAVAWWVQSSRRRSLAGQLAAGSGSVLDAVSMLQSEGRADRTIRLWLAVVGSWYGWLEEHRLVNRSPVTRRVRRTVRVDQAAVRKGDGMRQALTKDEAQRVATWATSEADPAVGFAVLAQMVGGLRSCEVCRLRIDQITTLDGVTSMVVKGKGRKTRRVVLEPVVAAAWQRYLQVRPHRPGPALMSRGGKAYTTVSVQNWAKEAAKVVGRQKDISSHDLRKTAATLLMDAGASLEEVQKHLGHSSPVLTAACYVTRRRQMGVTTGVI